jgi:putative glutathione S-transferase
MNVSYKNSKVESKEDWVEDNVDILFSIKGGKPPILPLREELQTDGIELVYNAKGTGHSAVSKDQRRREEILLDKLKRIEKKLEEKPSYKRTRKRRKALKMVKDLRHQMENSASGISYQRYLDELREMKRNRKKSKSDDASQISESSTVNTVNTVNIESKIIKALQTLFDDPEIDIDGFSDVNTLEGSRISEDSSTAITAEISATDSNLHADQQGQNKVPIHTISLPGGRDGSSTSTHKESCNEKPSIILAEKISRPALLQNRASSTNSRGNTVRFKDVRPSTAENLTQAKALLSSAKGLRRSFSNGSSSSLENSSKNLANEMIGDSGAVHSSHHQHQKSATEKSIISEKNRYHLFVSHACPWSHKCLIVRALKRLEEVISVSYVKCNFHSRNLWESDGATNDISFWRILDQSSEEDNNLQDLKRYCKEEKDIDQIHVPILWDKKENRVVNKKSTEIMKIMNCEFNKKDPISNEMLSKRPKLNIFPTSLIDENETIDQWIYEKLYIGIYKCGLATTQSKYDEAIEDVTQSLDVIDRVVKKRGFLVGQRLTESDICLFAILFRFDDIYRVLFKVNTRNVSKMRGLMDFIRDIYNLKGVAEISDLESIKKEYYAAQGTAFIVPRGSSFLRLLSNKDAII